MKAPTTGPVVRVNGYSMMLGAESTSASGVELNSPPQNSMTLRIVSPQHLGDGVVHVVDLDALG